MNDENQTVTVAGELLLDPFAFHLNEKSAIKGLGGHIKPTDPSYALHTEYVRVAEGPANFTLRFQGLTAKMGTLLLRVHILVEGPPPRCLVANTVRIQFNRLIQLGSEVSIGFAGMKGVKFGLYGGVQGECDAEAALVTVTLDRPALDEEEGEPETSDLRNTDFGLSSTKAVPLLHSADEPTLARPVSQLATLSQVREPACVEWRKRLGLTRADDRTVWSTAYVLQAIRAYGLLQHGARGVGFGSQAEAIAAVARSLGAEAETAALPDIAEGQRAELTGFDFLWSIDTAAAAGVMPAFGYVERMMRCLRPGGLAVHVVPFLPGRLQRRQDPPTDTFRRGEIERLAFVMISRKMEVAQLKIDAPDPLWGDTATGLAGVGAFGLVLRQEPLAE